MVDGSGYSIPNISISVLPDKGNEDISFIPDIDVLDAVLHFSTRSRNTKTETDPMTGAEICTYQYRAKQKYKTVRIEATSSDGSSVVWTSRHCQVLALLLKEGHDRGDVDGPKRKYYAEYGKDGEPKLDKNGKPIRKPGPKRKAFQSDIAVLSVSETLDQLGMRDTKDNRKALTKIMNDIRSTVFTITRDSSLTFKFIDRLEHRRGYYIAFWGSEFLDIVEKDGYRAKPYPNQLFALAPGKTRFSGGNFFTAYQLAHYYVMQTKKDREKPIKLTIESMLEFNPMIMSLDEYKLIFDKRHGASRPGRDMRDRLEGYLMELDFMDFQHVSPEGLLLNDDEAEAMSFEDWSRSSILITYKY